ncbi:MAG: hypothetical protein O3C32_07020 [Bacteroidetes bacterium]|nr:hypothetical protein [Bacteroidota bacterium]
MNLSSKLAFCLCIISSLAGYAQSVGIQTNSPDPSAALEVAGQAQGILPPRLTTAQRNTIVLPAEGLVLYNTDTHCLEVNEGTPQQPNWICLSDTGSGGGSGGGGGGGVHFVGELWGGGIVFYVNTAGDHGLVAALQDQSAGINYGLADDAYTNPNNHDNAGKAFTDWRMPSRYELNLMYQNLHLNGLGNFALGAYWSSSCNDNSLPIPGWTINFSNAAQSTISRSNNSIRVRAIREF